MIHLIDAHNHLQDPAVQRGFKEVLSDLRDANIGGHVVNGTCEDDWPAVAALADEHPKNILPSFGLHPWKVAGRSPRWLETLSGFIESNPRAGVGECGLDRWIKDHDLDDQLTVFLPQVALAARLNRPLTIHCLRAWGALLEVLRDNPLPGRGFLLHAYGGAPDLVPELTTLGAYFSFSGSFLASNREAKRETFRAIPRDRLLLETDAPAMPLPENLARYHLPGDGGNHPANLRATFTHFAAFLEMEPEKLRATLWENEQRFFDLQLPRPLQP